MRYYVRLFVGWVIVRVLKAHAVYCNDGKPYIIFSTMLVDSSIEITGKIRIPEWLAKCQVLYLNRYLAQNMPWYPDDCERGHLYDSYPGE